MQQWSPSAKNPTKPKCIELIPRADACGGVAGIATRDGGDWVLGDPLVEATGLNTEFEPACLVHRDGRYCVFWSTQRHPFSSSAVTDPNGQIAAYPLHEPTQSYS